MAKKWMQRNRAAAKPALPQLATPATGSPVEYTPPQFQAEVIGPDGINYIANLTGLVCSQPESVGVLGLLSPLYPKGMSMNFYNAIYECLGVTVVDLLAEISQTSPFQYIYPAPPAPQLREYWLSLSFVKKAPVVETAPNSALIACCGVCISSMGGLGSSGKWVLLPSTYGPPQAKWISSPTVSTKPPAKTPSPSGPQNVINRVC
jgi:hypothetical protein